MPCNMAVLEMAGTVLERDELYELKLKIDQHKHLVTSCFVSRTFPNSRLRFGPKSKNSKATRQPQPSPGGSEMKHSRNAVGGYGV